jgi:glutamate---cysteine ligase / carboxylate-amine ligase
MSELPFKSSKPLTIGIELELQLLNRRDCDLTHGAQDLIRLVEKKPHPGEVKPEITESMVEISTGILENYAGALAELRTLRDALLVASRKLNLLVAGGGAHPFQRWNERQIYDKPRFRQISTLYGYLAKQFTIFGQHVHVGVPDGDAAMFLTHAMSRYVPHFIALAASSPYHQGVDTSFDSSRLNAVFAFPLSGRAPVVSRWRDFVVYYEKMRGARVIESMKDFYWDIRPKPEFGTIEIRVFDTPLTVEKAAVLAAYAQALARLLLEERKVAIDDDLYLAYTVNRFQACRFGLDGLLIDAGDGSQRSIGEDILATCERLAPHAQALASTEAIAQVQHWATARSNDAGWLRACHEENRSLGDVMWRAANRWSESAGVEV